MWLATLFRPQSLIPQTSPPENPVYKHNNQLDILFAKKNLLLFVQLLCAIQIFYKFQC